jgi:benzoylformate decarboxylase
MAFNGAQALVRLLADAGVSHLFGNPGTTELPLNDALVAESRIRYILGLQEVPVMAMADGYAMASRRLGVVNLHISCGLGNAMGMLYNAYREGTPLLVTAGQQDRRLKLAEPILGGDMVSVARPWTKWAHEVERVEDLPAVVRRAAQLAMTPPTGPVFLALPMDLQLADASHLELTPWTPAERRVRPSADALRAAARLLSMAANPGLLVGSRVNEADAVAELVAVAERLGAAVFAEPGHTAGRLAFPPAHPLYAQTVGHWAPEIAARLAEFDVLLVVGTDLLREYIYLGPDPAIPRSVRVVHLDQNIDEIGKNYPVEVAVPGDPKWGLSELDALLAATMASDACDGARRRAAVRAEKHAAAAAKLRAQIDARRATRPMHPSVLMESLSRVLPDDLALVEEAVTTTNTTFQRLGALKNTSGYFAHRGWALGWGLGCSLGVKLAWPQRPVLAILGEGASLYGIQGLWSAAHHRVNVTFVIANNAQYQILKAGAANLGLPAAVAGQFIGMDLRGPEIDMVSLARAMGVEAQRVSEPEELAEKVKSSLAAQDRPRLFDVPIERSLAGPS